MTDTGVVALNKNELRKIILAALAEDMPYGDITTDMLINPALQTKAYLLAREEGVIAGMDVAAAVFRAIDDNIVMTYAVHDGQSVKQDDVIAEISGSSASVLKGERTALNFLQRLSGIATITGRYCRETAGLPVRIADTRKTTPGLRMLEKYAVRVGGGSNHRFSLSDGILIKDNHIKAAGGVASAVSEARRKAPHTLKIEVETETLEQVLEALDGGADIIMLDNMDVETMKKAVVLVNGRAMTEASGRVRIENVKEIAMTGVDIISVGALTHSAKSLDISLEII